MRTLANTYIVEIRLRHHEQAGRAMVCLGRPSPAELQSGWAAFLHPDELTFFASLEVEDRQRSYLLERYCAKQAICTYLGRHDPGKVHVANGIFEQPVVHHPWGPSLQASLSSVGEVGVAVAFPEAWPLGVDVERADTRPAGPEDSLILPAERKLLETVRLSRSIQPAKLLWTARQALSRVLRAGRSASPEPLEIDEVEVTPETVRCSFKYFRQHCATTFLLERFLCTLVHPKDVVLEVDHAALQAAARGIGSAGAVQGTGPSPSGRRPSSRSPVIFMFSGQGSQYYHMGRELLDREPVFREWMNRANEHLRSRFGLDVLGCIYDPVKTKSHPFDNALYSTPAIFMVQYALAQVLLSKGRRPDYLLGSSLGEYIAATVADAMDLEVALETVVTLALMVREHCEEGGMTAILANESLFRAEPVLHGGTELAAINFDGHFVISGAREPMQSAEHFLKEHGIGFQPLPVTYGFHSSLMEPVGPVFRDYLQWVPLRSPQIPIISCAEVGVLERVTPAHLWKVGRGPILLQHTIQALQRGGEHTFVDLSPSGTLASCVKYNLPRGTASRSLVLMTPSGDDLRTLAEVAAAVPAAS